MPAIRAATTPLTLTEAPGASGFFSAVVNDAWETLAVAGADDWSLEGEVGDLVSARIETAIGNSRPKLRLLNAANATLYTLDGATDGVATMYAFRLTTPGTYRVRVYTDNEVGNYALRVDVGRGTDLEVEANDATSTATRLTPKAGNGQFTFSGGGILPATDTLGDFYLLGLAPGGTQLNATAQLPGSTLTAGDIALTLFEQRTADRSLNLTSSTYATIPHHAVFDQIETANALTIEAWVFLRTFPQAWYTVLDKYEQTGDWGWAFGIQSTAAGLTFSRGTNNLVTAGVTPTTNVWHHVAVTYDHAANEIRFYLDGALVATQPSPGPLTDTSGEPGYLGFSPSGGDEYSDGPMAELRLWNRALTTTEIQANYLAHLVGNEANLVGLWRFDEGTGTVADDASATGNDAILGGGDPVRVPGWTIGAIRSHLPVAGTTLSRTFPVTTSAWLQIAAAANRGLTARYQLGGTMAESGNLNVASLTLPAEAATTTSYVQSFSVTFDDELDPLAANTLANFDLRATGPDTLFNTADDDVYALASPAYVNGTTLNFALVSGPLQPGIYRFTIGLGLHDRFGNPLASTFTRNFTVQLLGGFRTENRSNNTLLTATSLAASGGPGAGSAGSWRDGVNYVSGGNNPGGIAAGDFNSDGKLDLVSANYNGNNIGVLLGNGDGTFAAAVTYAVPNNAYKVVVGDLNGDTRPDVAVTRRNGGAVRVFLNLNDGTGALAAGVDYATATGPVWLALRDLDGDTDLDLAVANYEGNSVSILANNGNGTFAAAVNTAVDGNPHGVAIGDLNSDGRLDLAVVVDTTPAVKIFHRQTDGSYLAGPSFDWTPPNAGLGPFAIAIDDINGDNRADVVAVLEYGSPIRRWHQQADGSLVEAASFGLTTAYNYALQLVDYDSDGDIDLLCGRSAVVLAYENLGGGIFAGAANLDVPSNARQLATGDFNADGRLDIATTTEAGHALRVFLARGPETLAADGAGSLGLGRGNLSDAADVDNFSFSARAGDRVIVGSENPAHAANTGLTYRIYRPEGDEIVSFNSANGTGQTQFVAPVSGVYFLRVAINYTYLGEYRFSVALIPSTYQLESEVNDNFSAADALSFATATGSLSASVAGYVRDGDPGDVFALGFLDEGTGVTLNASRPPSSNLVWMLDVLNSTGAVVASEIAGAATLNYTIPLGQSGNFHARIRASTGADLFAQYRLAVTLADTELPAITADTLPAEGTTVTNFFGHFGLTFSENLQAASVNALANYELRAAGVDALFDTADDVVYSVALTAAYATGRTASYHVTDGPTLPGTYRFQARTGLRDLYLNALPAVYTRTFTVTGVAPYVLESRSNNTVATATSLAASGGEGAAFSGSWRDGVNYASGGNNPGGIAAGDFNGDSQLDLVSANYNGNTIGVLLGNGDGTFAAAVTYAVANNAYKVVVGDLNGDTRPDVAVTRRNGGAVRVFLNLNDGTGALAAGVDYATATGPAWLALRDLDGDTDLDLVVANYEGNSVSILSNNGNGTFAAAANTPVAGNPHGIAVGDLNGDGRLDLAVAVDTTPAVKIFHRQTDGSYLAGPSFDWTPPNAGLGPFAVEIADLNGDNRADVVAALEYASPIRRWHQQADGTLVEAASFGLTTAYNYSLSTLDYDGDGDADLLCGRSAVVLVYENMGGGVFAGPAELAVPSNARQIVGGDFNADGRPDIATTSEGSHALRVFLGRGVQTLPVDGIGGLGLGRGNLSSSTDVDYFSFSARAGNRVILTSENPGHAANTGLRYYILRPEGDEMGNFASINGSGQMQFGVPVSGIYHVRVQVNYTYAGEYRFALAVFPESVSLESEDNNALAGADTFGFAQAVGTQTVTVGGVLYFSDPADWTALGLLDEGTQITLAATKPPSSNLVWILDVMNSAGAVVAPGAAGVTPVTYNVPVGQAGAYYARIRPSAGADLFAQYRLAITLADTTAPTITGDNLPAEGSTATNLFDRFTLSFSEALQAASVNALANYDLRAAGGDALFDTPDDELYTVTMLASYSTGLSASYLVNNGPFQPGLYRFQAKTGLRDLYLNPLPAEYARTFSVAGVAPYEFESRSNNTVATATSLAASGGEGVAFSGSWRDGVNYAAGGNNTDGIGAGDFNNDGKLDLVSANYNGNNVGVLLGNGDGTFAAAVVYAAPNNPFKVVVGDLNGDTRPDVAVSRRSGGAVRVFLNLNDGSGALASGVDYATGAGPIWLALRDLDGDTDLDLVTANYEGNSVSVLSNNGNGTFAAAVNTAVTGNPYGLAIGDLNGDARLDFAVTAFGEGSVKILYRQENGAYAPGPVYAWAPTNGPVAVAIADLNGDTRADVVSVLEYGMQIRRWHQQADGTLLEGAAIAVPNGYSYFLSALDYDGDGDADLLCGRSNLVLVYENVGGVLAGPAELAVPSNARQIVGGDFNADGRPDVATTSEGNHALRVFLGRGVETLPVDGTGGLGLGRGNLSSSTDVDYFSFSARAGNRVILTSENPGHAANTGLRYYIFRPEGDEVGNFASINGSGQIQFGVPVSGVYHVRVQANYTYAGEYRFAVAVFPEAVSLESEDNNALAGADTFGFAQAVGTQTVTVGGVLYFSDPADWTALGLLDEGTQITLGATKPPSSNLVWLMDVMNSAGAVVATGAAGVTPVAYTVPVGQAGAHYARIRASAGADLLAQYRLAISLADTTAPRVTGNTQPAEGTTITSLFDRFTLSFTEDMQVASVNNLASYDLRAAGVDGFFDTGDDVVVPLVLNAAYSSGLSVVLRTASGATLPVGSYRFQARAGLLDRYLNPLAPVHTRTFTVAQLPGYVYDIEPNSTLATATLLPIISTQPDLAGGGGRGYLLSGADVDFWSFDLLAGDRVYLQGEIPGNPTNSGLNYQLFNPAGASLATVIAEITGSFVMAQFTAADTGAYKLRVAINYTYTGEYRFRVYVQRGGLQVESEANNTIATADAMTLTPSDNNRMGSLAGVSRTSGELDYFNLGTLDAGSTAFLSTRQPAHSTFVSVVSLYNAAGTLMGEATGGRTGDGVVQVPITVTGVYYALVRTSGATGGLASEYILDALVVPTADVSFPNLQVTSLTPPAAAGLQSGGATTVSFRVDNLGNLATPAVTWIDRIVLSIDQIYGNADDLELAALPHNGPLAAAGFYTVANTPITLPDGISGDFHVIVRTDHTNTVAEFVLEGDNETTTDTPITITLANYADLLIEDLIISEPDVAGVRTATWTLANRGTGTAAAGFDERFLVRNTTTGVALVNTVTPINAALAPEGTVARSATFSAINAGNYAVEVTADALAERYEFNPSGHTAAETNNLTTAAFAVVQLWTITVSADPAIAAGSISGAGTFAQGSSRTAAVTTNTPYIFLGWFEGGFLRSTNSNYTFVLTSNRTLVARFATPSFVIATPVAPPGSGVVTGGGSYPVGAPVNLVAAASPGYSFVNWTESGAPVGTSATLSFASAANRTITANFSENNPSHVVTTASVPAGVAVVTGGGTFTNTQSTTITAPASFVANDTQYTFQRFTLNGAPAGTAASITKTFTTLDPPALAYVAEYNAQSLKPNVVQVTSNFGNPIPATTNFRLTIRFDRAMSPATLPLVELLSANAAAIPAVSAAGTWSSADTYQVPPITFGATNGGNFSVRVSAAKDTQDHTMAATEVYAFAADVTAPPLPVLTAGTVTATSVPVTWNGYVPPADLASFRVYRSTATFTSLDGLSPLASLPANALAYTFTGLDLDTDYFVAVVPVDAVGNTAATVTPLTVRIGSTIPATVVFDVIATATNAARVTWTFNAAPERGFEGFKVYREAAAFTSLAGLTPVATLPAAARLFNDPGLDRAVSHHYVVVGYNRVGQSITTVTSKAWTDPLSGTLTTNFTVTEPLLIITQPVTISAGATFTVPPGTTVAFGPGAGLTVQSGRLIADGTVFAPIVFTSLADIEGDSTAPGDWEGITLADTTRSSTLRHAWINYGKGLAITGGAHTVDVFGAAWNAVGGLRLAGTVSLTTANAYLANNAVGASIDSGASLTLSASVLKNNTVNAVAAGAGALNASSNWWGITEAAAIAAKVSGPVNTASPLASEPVLTRGLRSVDATTSTGVANLPLLFASLNATGYRVSEDSSFAGVLFVDVPRDPLSPDLFNTAPWTAVIPLSAGGGTKILYAQFRGPTGAVSPTVSFTTNYVTTGPAIGAFSLTEGQSITRPINVSGSANSALDLASLTFSVDGLEVATSTTSPLNTLWDLRTLASGIHSVRLAATDVAGNLATRTLNVIVAPVGPPKPVLTAPANNARFTVNRVTVSGTAEPLIDVRIFRNGAVVATVTANAAGVFSALDVLCVEGTNQLVATAYDTLGSADSAVVAIDVDSGPPAAVTLLPIVYHPGDGLFVDWDLPASGEVPVYFRVFWHDAPFTALAQATGQSIGVLNSSIFLKTVPNGLRYFAVVGYDEAGNVSALSNAVSFDVDLTLPSFTVAFDQAMPIGPGTLGITITASEALRETPILLMRPQGGAVLSLTLTPAGGTNYTVSFPVTTLSARSGTATLAVTGTDLAGNRFTGAPAGAALVFDVTKPTGVLTTSVADPVQTTTDVALSVSLVLSELPKPGTTPTLSFSPPIGALVPLPLTGSGLNWNGQVTLTPAMGDGNSTFLFNAQDAAGNAGTVLTSGERLELYTGASPTAPAVPGGITVLPLKGGYIRVSWTAAAKAETYRLYREAGASAAVPTILITADITSLSIDDLPPADGPYRYVVTAHRLGAESGPSGVRATTSDRTPPVAPSGATAVLAATGINVGWTPGVGEAAAKWVVYRNGVAIRTVNSPDARSFVDSPPRGVMTYAVAAADTLGNEALGPTATIELFVGAITNLRATVDTEIGTDLTWTSPDATAIGFNVYRNGAKQNAAPLTVRAFSDTFDAGGLPVLYAVKAVNAAAQESAARTVLVQPLDTVVRLNPTPDGDAVSVARYFDGYELTLTAGANASAPIEFASGEIIRAVDGETPVQATFTLPPSLAVGATTSVDVVVPAPNLPGASQGASLTLSTEPDAGGSTVLYRHVADYPAGTGSGVMMSVTANLPPLAGGANDFVVRVFNQGHAAADFVLSRAGNTQPGDLRMLVVTADGVLASSTPYQGTVPGVIINGQGDAFLRLAPGASADIPFPGVVVPEALGSKDVSFRARFEVIYHAVGTAQQRTAGPLEGAMASSLRVTPYFGTAVPTQPAYANDQPVVINGQSLDRTTGLPVPNVPLRLGIRVQGAVLYRAVTTDGTGAYHFEYTPSLGLAGEMVLWAAHPEVVDQLDQARVRFYRMFTKPGRATVTMSKNDRLDFDIGLLNLGDLPIASLTLSFRAFQMISGVETNVPGITGVARTVLPAAIGAKAEAKLNLRLLATLDVPDDALFEFTFATAEGATTTFTGTISFRPALAVLTTVSPTVGYAEAGVPRGGLKSVDVMVENRGLRALTGARLVPPAGVPWFQLNLAPDATGNIPLPDIPVGGSRSFTVVFAPPESTPVGFYNDFLLIKGDNAVGDYRLNLFATVTSEEKGSVQFAVTNTFSNPVPNTTIWLRNTTIGTEIGPVFTDVNGGALVSGLMEGDWQWKTAAAGHGATQGVVAVVPDQTVGVETELTLSMVSVKFSVVPVPFTDYYEIKIEQTFQTRTPIPNVILSPPHQTLSVQPGWSGTLLYTLRNEGLRSTFEVKLSGGDLPTMRLTPLINYLPELRAQETVEIPVFFEYFGPDASLNAQGVSGGATARALAQAAAGDEGSLAALPRDRAMAGAMAPAPEGDPRDRATAAGLIDTAKDIYDCYKDFKYGTITLRASTFIDSVSGKKYTVGINATIDVDALLEFICDGKCPDLGVGDGLFGTVAQDACGKVLGKAIEQLGKITKIIDVSCKASNIIKALACALAQLGGDAELNGKPLTSSGTGGAVTGNLGYPPTSSASGNGCFVAGTPITFADGTTKPIETIAKGDNLQTQLAGHSDAVAEVMCLGSDHVRELSFRLRAGGTAVPVRTLRLTHDHRVWVDGTGWMFSLDVPIGAWLHGVDGQLYEVIGNERLPGHFEVYGLHMDDDNVFYAGGILAEDQCFHDRLNLRVSSQPEATR